MLPDCTILSFLYQHFNIPTSAVHVSFTIKVVTNWVDFVGNSQKNISAACGKQSEYGNCHILQN